MSQCLPCSPVDALGEWRERECSTVACCGRDGDESLRVIEKEQRMNMYMLGSYDYNRI